jgi:hypothetical protein
MNEPSNTWWTDKINGEHWVLFSIGFGLLHMVAPPGVGFRSSEPDEERVMWRHAIWIGDADDPPAVGVDAPFSVACMETREVVEFLPPVYHGFVRSAMVRHISHAVTFGLPEAGRRPDDGRALRAGRALTWLVDQLDGAFPSETWFRFKVAALEIPDTIEELLRLIPAGEGCWSNEPKADMTHVGSSEATSSAAAPPRAVLRGGY